MITVSNYHYIREHYNNAFPSIFGVTPQEFKSQLKKFKNDGDFIMPSDFLKNYDELVQSKDNFYFITFDDGLKEQFEFAVPILDEFDTQAIYFANSINSEEKRVSTVHKIHLLRSILSPQKILNHLESNKIEKLSDHELELAQINYRFDDSNSATLKYLLNFKIPFEIQEKLVHSLFEQHFSEKEICDLLYMNDYQLKYLADLNCLGSHSHSHFPLGLLDENKLNYELSHSKLYFENLTKSTIQMIAYPYGTPIACNDVVANAAKAYGYSYGFTVKTGKIDEFQNKLLLNRFDCNDLIGGKNYK